MHHMVEEGKIIVFEELKPRTSFDKKNGVPKITIGPREIIEYVSNHIEIQKYKLISNLEIGNCNGLPNSGTWTFELVEDEECGQTKLIPKIFGNLKRSLKKENGS